MVTKFVYLAFIVLPSVEAEVGLILQHYSGICHKNNTLFKVFECESTKQATGRYLYNLRFMASKNIGKDVQIHIKKQGTENSVLKLGMDEMRRTTNLPFKCPLKANFLYKFVNSTITARTLPPYVPAMNETFSLTFYDKNEYAASYCSSSTYVSGRN